MPLYVDFDTLHRGGEGGSVLPTFRQPRFEPLPKILEFPLTFSHLGVDAFVVDASVEAEVKVVSVISRPMPPRSKPTPQ